MHLILASIVFCQDQVKINKEIKAKKNARQDPQKNVEARERLKKKKAQDEDFGMALEKQVLLAESGVVSSLAISRHYFQWRISAKTFHMLWWF